MCRSYFNLSLFCAVLSVISSADVLPEARKSSFRECKNEYSVTCFKMDVINFVERLSNNVKIPLFGGISIVKDKDYNETTNAEIVADLARSYPNDPEIRLDQFLLKKMSNFVQSRSLRIKFADDTAVEEANSDFSPRKGGGGGGKKKGGMEGILAAMMMMKGTLMAVALGALALLAGKALMSALLALMLSSIVGLKSLASGGKKSTHYEIIAKPVYAHSNSYSQSHEDIHSPMHHSGYGRSMPSN